MLKAIFSVRYVVWIMVPFVLLNVVAFTTVGIIRAVEGYMMIIHGEVGHGNKPGILLVESLERFLIAFVMFVFALGLLQLFLLDKEKNGMESKIPAWLKMNNFMDLKLVLWEAVLTSLLVFIVSDITKYEGNFTWNVAILPAVLLLVTISFFLLKKVHH